MKKYTNYNTIILILVLILSLHTSVFGQGLNFAGNWNYNKVKSDLTSYPSYFFPDKFVIAIDSDTLTVQAIFNNLSAINSPSKYSLKGSIALKKYADGSERQTSFKVESNKRSIVKHSVLLKGSQIIRTTDEIWALSSDEQSLTILLTEQESSTNSYSVKGFFERSR